MQEKTTVLERNDGLNFLHEANTSFLIANPINHKIRRQSIDELDTVPVRWSLSFRQCEPGNDVKHSDLNQTGLK